MFIPMAAHFNWTNCELQQFWVIPLTVFSTIFICLLQFVFACSFKLLCLFSAFGVQRSNIFNTGLICSKIATWFCSRNKKKRLFKTTEQCVPMQNPDFMFFIKNVHLLQNINPTIMWCFFIPPIAFGNTTQSVFARCHSLTSAGK